MTFQRRNAYLTFDCEWCDNIIGTSPRRDAREIYLLREGLLRFLEICKKRKHSGTIFVTADVVSVVKDQLHLAIDQGFRIGNHSLNHSSVAEMTLRAFREDLHQSTLIIEDAIGCNIDSYRAPSFSMPISLSYYEIMRNLGYQYDFSAAIGRHQSSFGCSIDDILNIHAADMGIKLIPTVGIGRSRSMFLGGGYFRAFSASKLMKAAQETSDSLPHCLYLHPRDMLRFYFPRNTLSLKKFLKSAIGGPLPIEKLSELFDALTLLSLDECVDLWEAAFGEMRENKSQDLKGG